jgi:hypothetical protein
MNSHFQQLCGMDALDEAVAEVQDVVAPQLALGEADLKPLGDDELWAICDAAKGLGLRTAVNRNDLESKLQTYRCEIRNQQGQLRAKSLKAADAVRARLVLMEREAKGAVWTERMHAANSAQVRVLAQLGLHSFDAEVHAACGSLPVHATTVSHHAPHCH